MSLLADILSTVFERRYARAPGSDSDDRSVAELCHALIGNAGEVTGSVLARRILDRYAAMDMDARRAFFGFLADGLGIDAGAVRHTLTRYEDDRTKANYRAFMAAAEPARQELARRLNQVPGATEQLVRMRADLLAMLRDAPELAEVDLDFRHLFASWFNRGFLVLRPISWESPAEVLEKIIAYEAVHTIESWDDLRRRVQPSDRRCFGFFHPAMPGEPLIFVEVALTRGVPGSVQGLLADGRTPLNAEDADTAVFYSISNCQEGLAGISFGNSLIKQVVADLSREVPGLSTFVTLSPIPGLARWMADNHLQNPGDDETRQEQLAARYLLEAKRDDGMPVDPVARFHLGNGAMVHKVHARADLSVNGLAQSGGAMVNYLYDLNRITENHERFATAREVIASAEVRALSQAPDPETA